MKVTLRAEKWVNNGFCLGYLNEETFFISGAIPGELVECEAVSITKKFKQVKVISVLEPSADRILSDCDQFLLCGGCTFRHIPYAKEIEIKKNLFLNEFNHKFPLTPLTPSTLKVIQGSELKYRNNVQFKIQNQKKGFFKNGSNDLVEFPKTGCLNLPDELNESIKEYRPDSEKEGKLRFTDKVFDYGKMDSIFHLDTKTIRVPAGGFFQINRHLIEEWLKEIIQFLPADNLDILELFSGSGLISLFLSSRCKSLVGYEMETNSVSYSKENAKFNQAANLEFHSRNLYQDKISTKHLSRPLWVMNPPRNGLGSILLEQIQAHTPNYIIYSSCNYITLIQDLKKIIPFYSLQKATIADFFPRTPYFETLVLMKKNTNETSE